MSRAQALLAAALFGLVCLAALPLGANRPWAWIALPCLAALLFCWQGVLDLLRTPEAALDLRKLALAPWLFLGVLLWIFAQTLGWVPESWRHPAYLDLEAAGSISVWPERTAQFGLRLLGYGLIFWIALRCGRDAALARRGLGVFAAFVSLLSCYGLVLALVGSETLLWFDKWAMHHYVTATFVNKNSFATYAGLGFLVNLALTIEALKPAMAIPATNRKVALRRWLHAVYASAWPWLVGCLLCGSALLATASRGGFLATVFGTAVLLLALFSASRSRAVLPLALGVLLPVAVFLLWNASGEVLLRLGETEFGSDLRSTVYDRVLQAIADAGALGSGAGSFQEAFRPYKTEALGGFTWDLAHSSYLENAMELGWAAALALVLAIAGPVYRCFAALRERRRRRYFGAVGLAATVLVGLHATVDFSLQMPAIAAAYALLLGLAWAQSWPSERS